jgi:hypothetical protein
VQECDHLIWLPLNLLRVYHFWGASVHLGQVGADFGTKVFIFVYAVPKQFKLDSVQWYKYVVP